MNTEQKKEYNKTYYILNKDKIMTDLCTKIECPFCGRTVIKNNVTKHEKSNICLKLRARKIELAIFNSNLLNHY